VLNKLHHQVAISEEAAHEEAEVGEDGSQCYAQLIGFGTAKAAQDYVIRLKKKGIPVFCAKTA